MFYLNSIDSIIYSQNFSRVLNTLLMIQPPLSNMIMYLMYDQEKQFTKVIRINNRIFVYIDKHRKVTILIPFKTFLHISANLYFSH